MQTAQRRAELDAVSRQQKVDTDQRDALQAKQTEIATRVKGLDETEASLQERRRKVDTWMAETQAKVRR